MKLKKLYITLAILTMVCLLTATVSPAANITTSDYWVLTDGYSAQFTNSGTLSVTYGNFHGKNVFFVDLMGTGTQMQNYDALGNLLFYGTYWAGGGYFKVDPAAALFPSEIETGKTYPAVSWQRIEYDDWGAYHGIGRDSVVVTVTDPMTITVPAGRFDDVYKFTLVDTWSDSWSNSGVSTSEYWMAKDIGWIKVMREGVTYDLLNVPILPPTATTGTATSVSTTTATLNGTVNPRGGSTTVVFEYGPTTGYGTQITATQSPLSGTTDQAVSAQLTGLSECTSYHFRVKATNSAGTDWGDDQTFTTSCGSKPTVKTNHASQVTLSSATLNGKVNPNGADTTWYFEYGLTTGYEWSTPSESAGSGSSKVSVSRSITGLSRDTTYHYRIVAENSRGESLGADQTFRTTIIYVEPYGVCGDNEPCYETIQEGIDAAGSGGTIKIAEESYNEDVAIGASGNVRLEGGWDASFTARSFTAGSSSTAVSGTVTITGDTDGTVLIDNLVLEEGVPCNYSISPTSKSFTSSGGSGSVSVTADTGCAWTATSNNSWTTITQGISGSGSGTVGYTVSANSSASSRTGTMTIAGETFTITQDGVSCTYSISPKSNTFTSNFGAHGNVSVSTPTGCVWSATSNDSWITITSGSSGSGDGTVEYYVSYHSSTSSRTGTMTIAGETFTVNQYGCTYYVASTWANFGGVSGTGRVTVASSQGCEWSATSNDSWITITSGSSGSGDGTVEYFVSYNLSGSYRTGTMTIAGETFTVNQNSL